MIVFLRRVCVRFFRLFYIKGKWETHKFTLDVRMEHEVSSFFWFVGNDCFLEKSVCGFLDCSTSMNRLGLA